MPNTWERLPDEPNRWYDRFEIYRMLGMERSVDAAYRKHTGHSSRANRHWYNAAGQWEWKQRAEAWDEAQRVELRQEKEAKCLDVRRQRLERIDYHKQEFDLGLAAAHLGQLSEADARRMVTALRLGFADMVRMERLEYGEVTERVAGDGGYPTLAPEVLRRLQLVYGTMADDDEDGEEDA